MPNWCEGTIKVRGQKSDVIKWLHEGTSGTPRFDIEEPKVMKISDCNDEIEVAFEKEAYCEGTRRHFIKGTAYCGYDEDGEYEPIITLCFDIKAAWGFDPDSWKKISEKYHLSFRLHGFEKGMCFEQILEVTDGLISIDEEKKYNDYDWEAFDSRLGG